jgi:hypothetical protein
VGRGLIYRHLAFVHEGTPPLPFRVHIDLGERGHPTYSLDSGSGQVSGVTEAGSGSGCLGSGSGAAYGAGYV